MNNQQCHVIVGRMTHKTLHFNEGQKVWVKQMTGAQAAFVIGKFRGSGRYISAWIKWERKPMPVWKTIPVAKSFADRHKLEVTR